MHIYLTNNGTLDNIKELVGRREKDGGRA